VFRLSGTRSTIPAVRNRIRVSLVEFKASNRQQLRESSTQTHPLKISLPLPQKYYYLSLRQLPGFLTGLMAGLFRYLL